MRVTAAGSTRKVGPLLEALKQPAYIALDISADHLAQACARLQKDHPDVPMVGICCDYSQLEQLPSHPLLQQRRLSEPCADQILDTFRQIDGVLGLLDFSDAAAGEQARRLIRERDRARNARDWAKADRLRDQLEELGVVVMDYKA